MEMPYIRVGTTYYKKVETPITDEIVEEDLIVWSKATIIDDLKREGKSINKLYDIPIYDRFIYRPDNVNFEQTFWNCYNKYHELSHRPSAGSWENIEKFLKHVFDDQFEAILDYIQLLYLKPLQKLPVICLISKEKKTGKSTFLKLLMSIFEQNTIKINSDSFSSNFNFEWTGKLIIALEEVKFEKAHLINKIKDLTTSNVFQVEKKGFDRETKRFFGKFVINSNHVEDFIKLEDEDNRFWVREVPKIETEDVDLVDKMKDEIPHFLHFLQHRELKHKNKTRFWFSKEVTWTKALRKVRLSSRSKEQFIIASSLLSAMEGVDANEIKFTVSDLPNLITSSGFRFNDPEIRKMLKQEWKLQPANNTLMYRKVIKNTVGSYYQSDAKGRYFTVTNKFLSKNFDDLMN